MHICRRIMCCACGLAAAVTGWAQTAPAQTDAGRESPRNALMLESVSLFGYVSNSVGSGEGGLSGVPLQTHFGMGGSSAVQWIHSRDRSHASMHYLVSYLSPTRYTDSATNHSLSLAYQKNLARTWTWTASAAGAVQQVDQAMFSASRFENAAGAPGTFDDLAGALRGSAGADPQLGAILSGAQVLGSPGSTLLYGTRLWSASVQTGLSWAPRPLTTIHFDFNGGRSGQLPTDQQRQSGLGSRGLVDSSTNASAGIGITHSLSPRTQVGVTVSTNRTMSRYQDAYYNTARASASRNLSRRWYGEIHGGVGFIRPVRVTQTVNTGAQYLGGGTLGYRTLAHTFLMAYDRTVGDQYGIGAGSTQTANMAWNWRRPGRSWWVQISGGYEYMPGAFARDLTTRRGAALFGRTLTRNAGITVQYAYMSYSGVTMLRDYSPSALRVGVVWSPSQPLIR